MSSEVPVPDTSFTDLRGSTYNGGNSDWKEVVYTYLHDTLNGQKSYRKLPYITCPISCGSLSTTVPVQFQHSKRQTQARRICDNNHVSFQTAASTDGLDVIEDAYRAVFVLHR